MKKTITGVSLFVLLIVIHSCYNDKEQLLYPNTVVCTDTTSVASYSQKVAPLLQLYCYNCHTGNYPSGNIRMGTYNDDKAIALSGKLYGSISYSAGFSPMPKGMARLTACQVSAIRKWIDGGMPNN